jgi:hypothetical protein
MIAKIILLASVLALATVNGADQINARSVFAKLQTLVGEWEGKTEAGRVLKVSYRLTANNTVLVETWTLGPQRESLTLYHMDNESLIATHYCALGNQPRLRLKEGEARPCSLLNSSPRPIFPNRNWRISIVLKWSSSSPTRLRGVRPTWRTGPVNRSASFTREPVIRLIAIGLALRHSLATP